MIHYHGTPLSGDSITAVRALTGKHAMVSLAAPSQLEIVAEVCQSFTFDNGAFTAWKQGKKYDMEAFAVMVERFYRHPGMDWYIIPDVIDGTEQDNRVMLGRWQQRVSSDIWQMGVPVWHLHESLETLFGFCNSFQRVALGSSGEYAVVGDSKWWSRMAEAMEVATDSDGRPLAKLHGLRMLSPTIFSHLPLSSADSTNVARNIGLCNRWTGPYTPKTKETRAAILMERIEAHCSASRWSGDGAGVQENFGLFG